MKFYSIYKTLPVFLQNIACSIKGYEIEKIRYRGQYEEFFAQAIVSDFFNLEDIRRYKEDHLARIIEYVYRYAPYYRAKYSKVGLCPRDFKSLEDLQKFPVLTKEEVRENWLGMLTCDHRSKDLIPYHTSGSTGKALDFFLTKESLQRYWAIVWRGRNRFGISRDSKHINFTGKIVVPIDVQAPPYWRYNWFAHQYMVNMQHITAEKVPFLLDFVNREKVDFFVGYPSIIHVFADLIINSGSSILVPPKFIFTGAEKVLDFQRSVFREAFCNTQVVEHYGFSENAACASKCTCGSYHEDFELGHLEIEGHENMGPLLATGFHNLAMPFVRYQIGDIASFSTSSCACGRSSQVIDSIDGRNEDYILTPEGGKFMRLDYIFKSARNIKECQVEQSSIDKIVLRIVRRSQYSIADEKEIVETIKTWISPKIEVEFEYVSDIPRTSSGKFKSVVSKLPS